VEYRGRTIIVIEGRDGAGKTTLARNLGGRVISLPRPTESELRSRYFARWLACFRRETATALVLDRSWYSRPCVEWPMGFCTRAELDRFYAQVPRVESALVRSGVRLLKIYIDITDAEQARRLARRESLSPIDRANLARPDDFRRAAEEMLRRTSTPFAPWNVIDNTGKGSVEWIGRYCSRDFVCSTREEASSASRS